MFEIMASVHALRENLEREEGQGQTLGVFPTWGVLVEQPSGEWLQCPEGRSLKRSSSVSRNPCRDDRRPASCTYGMP